MDEWSFQIEKLSDVKKAHEEYGYLSRVYDMLKIPDEDEDSSRQMYMQIFSLGSLLEEIKAVLINEQ